MGCELTLICTPVGPRGPIGPQGIPGTGATKRITEPYTIQDGDGALWVDLSEGSIPITLASLTKDAQVYVNDYLGLAVDPVNISLIGAASGAVDPVIVNTPQAIAILLYSLELDLWSVKL